jgi:hypothetical protein
VQQAVDGLLAVPAFLPATLCTGYAAAWFTNLHDFRRHSVVERLFWSVPLSVAISTISAVLIGKAFSLRAVMMFLVVSACLFVATLSWEHLQLKQSGMKWVIGWRPLGGRAFTLGLIWIVLAILSLIDFQSDHQLFMSLTIFDHASRVNWTQSILRTGIPPANPLYYYEHPAGMRYYYFWNVICAAVARISHLPVRAVYVAGCVWGGFILAALIGLYLKYFLAVGDRLRKQFLLTLSLICVSGFSSLVIVWKAFFRHGGLPGAPQIWAVAQLNSWYDSLLFVPHHISSMVCCMLAFLLAWMERQSGSHRRTASAVFIAAALASAFGLSIYVAFGFFLLMILWALWRVAIEHEFRPVILMAIGGAGAVVLLLPYLFELGHGTSGTHGGGGAGASLFGFAVRETFPTDGILAWGMMQSLAHSHPWMALSLSRLVVLLPGIAIELGVFLIVLVIYLIPALRGRSPLSPARKSLVFFAVAILLISSFIRSNVLDINDFGVRSALIMQFATLLMASDLILAWRSDSCATSNSEPAGGLVFSSPHWLRFVAKVAIVIGIITTIHQAIIFRFTIPIALAVTHMRPVQDPVAANISHNAYISAIGYGHLDATIPREAIVQPNPASPNAFWSLVDDVNIDRQRAIASDQPWCGSELGGDPSGCRPMAAAIAPLFNGATAEQARATCRTYKISYLVSRIYDPAWQNKQSWVWTLNPVVSDPEFRALACGH